MNVKKYFDGVIKNRLKEEKENSNNIKMDSLSIMLVNIIKY
jgi:hypothetical protein